jgi:hypothetical protein
MLCRLKWGIWKGHRHYQDIFPTGGPTLSNGIRGAGAKFSCKHTRFKTCYSGHNLKNTFNFGILFGAFTIIYINLVF